MLGTHSDDNVWSTKTEVELSGQNLLGLRDPSRQGQHQGRLVHKLVLIVSVLKSPLKGLGCTKIKKIIQIFPISEIL